VPVTSPVPQELNEFSRFEVGLLIDDREVLHIHFAVDDRLGFTQRYAMPTNVAVAYIRPGNDFAVHLAVNAGAAENAEAAAVTFRFVD
jgi:hypothetical protein